MIDDDEALDWGEKGPPRRGTWQPLEADSGSIRTARYDDNRRRRGQVRVSVWVPGDRADELRAIAAVMRG